MITLTFTKEEAKIIEFALETDTWNPLDKTIADAALRKIVTALEYLEANEK